MTHPYDEAYRDEIVETQGRLFERLQDDHPDGDGADFVRSYLASRTRAALDGGDAYLANLDSGLLKDYYFTTDGYRMRKGDPLRGFAPNWIGQFYARYQWEFGVPSACLIEAVPLDWLRIAYAGLHDLDLAAAVARVGREVAP